MTKQENDYEKMLKQMEALKERMSKTKEILDKQRDKAILDAVRATDITREEGFKLARLIEDKTCYEQIMKLEPELRARGTVRRRIKKNVSENATEKAKESEEE